MCESATCFLRLSNTVLKIYHDMHEPLRAQMARVYRPHILYTVSVKQIPTRYPLPRCRIHAIVLSYSTGLSAFMIPNTDQWSRINGDCVYRGHSHVNPSEPWAHKRPNARHPAWSSAGKNCLCSRINRVQYLNTDVWSVQGKSPFRNTKAAQSTYA